MCGALTGTPGLAPPGFAGGGKSPGIYRRLGGMWRTQTCSVVSFSRYARFCVIKVIAGCNQKWYAYHFFSGIYHFLGGSAKVCRRADDGLFHMDVGCQTTMFDE